jgi:hypothetical protein
VRFVNTVQFQLGAQTAQLQFGVVGVEYTFECSLAVETASDLVRRQGFEPRTR